MPEFWTPGNDTLILQADGEVSEYVVSHWGWDEVFLWFEEVGDPGVVDYVPVGRVETFQIRKPEAADD